MHDLSARKLFYSFNCCGKKEKDVVENALEEFHSVIRQIYKETKAGNGQKWLMIDLEDDEEVYT